MTIAAPAGADTSEILFAPNPERIATTNAWAFMHWLHSTRGITLSGWSALQAFARKHPLDFQAALIAYARLPSPPSSVVRHSGVAEALVFRRANAARISYSRDDLRSPNPSLPVGVTAPLTRLWPATALVRPFADVVLFGDIRPDDRVLVAGTSSWPWLAALLEGATVILDAAPGAAELLVTAEQERAGVLIAPATTIGETAFRYPGRRRNLATLRTIIAMGGPLSPEGRRRVYTWIRPDLMLLARSGDTTWGNPLEPVLARPAATPALFIQRPTRPAP